MKWARFFLMMLFAIVALAVDRALNLGGEGAVIAILPMMWSAYNTRTPDGLEIVPWNLWDTITYTSGTTVRAALFNAVRATRDLGNMTVASMLPNPFGFLARGIRFFIKGQVWSINQAASDAADTGGLNDAQLLGRTGVLSLTIGTKEAFVAPLWMITAGGGAAGPLAVAGGEATNVSTSFGQIGIPDPRAAYTFARPLAIDSAINFDVVLSWPAGAVTLEQGNTDLSVVLDGELSRPIQ
jgi:hypothetical protein